MEQGAVEGGGLALHSVVDVSDGDFWLPGLLSSHVFVSP